MPSFFSIVIPTYNRSSQVKEAVYSVLNQTFTSFEVIVVDDGSSDDTEQVVSSIMTLDSRVRYVYQENKERGAARNHGISLAKGKWICFLDSDDIFLPIHLEEIYREIKKKIPEKIVASRYFLCDPTRRVPQDLALIPSGKVPIEVFLAGNPFACNFCIKNKTNTELRFREEREFSIMEDWIFLIMNCQSAGVRLMSVISVEMRQHQGRSVMSHGNVVQSRVASTSFLLERLNLTEYQRRKLITSSAYFASLHAFLSGNRSQSISHYSRCILGPIPFSRKVLQLIRILLGLTLWCRLRRIWHDA